MFSDRLQTLYEWIIFQKKNLNFGGGFSDLVRTQLLRTLRMFLRLLNFFLWLFFLEWPCISLSKTYLCFFLRPLRAEREFLMYRQVPTDFCPKMIQNGPKNGPKMARKNFSWIFSFFAPKKLLDHHFSSILVSSG